MKERRKTPVKSAKIEQGISNQGEIKISERSRQYQTNELFLILPLFN